MKDIVHFLVFVLVSSALLGCAGVRTAPVQEHLALYTTKDDFETVKEDVVIAITNIGMVINNISYIGKMLERTRKDIGATRTLYLHAQALEFCSASISRQTMEADPTNIVFCPYVILVYVLPDEPNKVFVAYRRPQPVGSPESRASLEAVEDLLEGIVREALNIN